MFIVTFKFVLIFAIFLAVTAFYDDYESEETFGTGYNIFDPKPNRKKDGNDGKCDECGIGFLQNKQEGRGRVINGRAVTPIYKYPWIVALLKKENFISCGGALISANFVLTAAHCVFRKNMAKSPKCSGRKVDKTCYISPSELRVGLLGDKKWDISKTVKVLQITPHPLFSYRLHIYDLAIIKLSEPVHCSNMTMPVCLPYKDLTKVGQILITAGWGVNTPEGMKGRKILREGALKEVETKRCVRAYQPAGTDKNLVCAVGTETRQSNCKGDSGSAIFGYTEKKFYAVGVVSYMQGTKCSIDTPIAYANIFTALPWIKVQVKDLPKH